MNVAIPRVQPGVDRPGYELITSAVHQNTLPHEAIKHHHLSRRDTRRLGGWIQSDQCLPKRGLGGVLDFISKSNKRRVSTAGLVINAQDTGSGSCCCLIRYRVAKMHDDSCRINFCLSVCLGKAVVLKLQMWA